MAVLFGASGAPRISFTANVFNNSTFSADDFLIGFWMQLSTYPGGGGRALVATYDGSDPGEGWKVQQASAGSCDIQQLNGGSWTAYGAGGANLTSAADGVRWHYLIASTQRDPTTSNAFGTSLSIFDPQSGTISAKNANQTTKFGTLGSSWQMGSYDDFTTSNGDQLFSSAFAELFIATRCPQHYNETIPDEFVRQCALNGPFNAYQSLGKIDTADLTPPYEGIDGIFFYNSLRDQGHQNTQSGGRMWSAVDGDFYGARGDDGDEAPDAVSINQATLSPHPPFLSSNYNKPGQNKRVLLI